MLGSILSRRFLCGAAASSGPRLGACFWRQQEPPAACLHSAAAAPPRENSDQQDIPFRLDTLSTPPSEAPAGFRCFSSSNASTSSASEPAREVVSQSVAEEASLATQDNLELVDFEYTGPFSAAVKRVKVLSVGSFGVTLLGAPLLLYLQGDPTMTMGAKFGIAGTLASFGAFTTGMLQWFASPYVCHLKFTAATNSITAQTLSFFAQPSITKFHISEVKPTASLSPVSSFDVGTKTFYVDADHFDDKALLSHLVPKTEAGEAAAEQPKNY